MTNITSKRNYLESNELDEEKEMWCYGTFEEDMNIGTNSIQY